MAKRRTRPKNAKRKRNVYNRGGNSIRSGRRVTTRTNRKKDVRVSKQLAAQVKKVIRGEVETKILPLGAIDPVNVAYPINVASVYLQSNPWVHKASIPPHVDYDSCVSYIGWTAGSRPMELSAPQAKPHVLFEYEKYKPSEGTGKTQMTGKSVRWGRIKTKLNISLPQLVGEGPLDQNVEFRYISISPKKTFYQRIRADDTEFTDDIDYMLFLNNLGSCMGPASVPGGGDALYAKRMSYAHDLFSSPIMKKYFNIKFDRKFVMSTEAAANKGNMKTFDHVMNIDKELDYSSSEQRLSWSETGGVQIKAASNMPVEWHIMMCRNIMGASNGIMTAPVFGLNLSGTATYKDV